MSEFSKLKQRDANNLKELFNCSFFQRMKVKNIGKD